LFDPTIYENLKVVLEGAVYELDLAGAILVTGREDLVDLASMSRTYKLTFVLTSEEQGKPAVQAELVLHSGLRDFAAEQLKEHGSEPGCSFGISFGMPFGTLPDLTLRCSEAEGILDRVWGGRFPVLQTVSQTIGAGASLYRSTARLDFGRRFGEDVAEDFASLTDYTVRSLSELEEWLNGWLREPDPGE